MTTEQKAKAYDEALEKAAQLIENCGDNNGCKEMIRSIFPELVEIEDERIKYCLISLIASETAYDEFEKYNVDYDSVYAWLAKQGEQKPADEEEKGNVGGISSNSKWSEEDEKFVHGLIRGLMAKRDIHGHTTFSSDNIDITDTINWLDSLKNRVHPNHEWSEEDKDRKSVV